MDFKLNQFREREIRAYFGLGYKGFLELGAALRKNSITPTTRFLRTCVHAYDLISVAPDDGELERTDRWVFEVFDLHLKILETERREKREARASTRRAARLGIISRKPCLLCGDPVSEFHHSDYSDLLNVDNLCRSCHVAWHMYLRQNPPPPKPEPEFPPANFDAMVELALNVCFR